MIDSIKEVCILDERAQNYYIHKNFLLPFFFESYSIFIRRKILKIIMRQIRMK